MSYTPPAFTDAGGSITTGYTAPAFTDAGGDVAPPAPSVVVPVAPWGVGLLVVVVQLTVGGVTWYFSDAEYGDAGTNWHDPRVVGDIAFTRGVSCVLWADRRGSSGLGNIELINADGELDSLLTAAQGGGSVAVFVVPQDQPMAAATQVAAATVERIEGRGEQTARIVTGDVLALLDVPLQAALYASGDGVDTLIGRPRPVAIGKPLSCPVVLVDQVDYEYDCHDSDAFLVDVVRDSGYPLAEGTMPGDGYQIAAAPINGIELLQLPIGRVVVDVDATGGAVESIIGAAEGDFDTDLTDWTVTTESGGGTATAEWQAPGVAFLAGDNLLASPGSAAAYGELEFPSALVAGQTYAYTIDVDFTASGAALSSLVQVFFRPDSLAPGEYVTLGILSASAATTFAGTFVAPAIGHLVIRCGAGVGAAGQAVIDNVRLDRTGAGGNVADVVQQLLARAGIGADQIDSDALAALATDRPWPVSFWADGATSVLNVLQAVLDSVYGWMFTNALGQISVGYLQPPEVGASVLDLSEIELAGEVEIEPDLAPGLSTTVSGGRNWYRYGPGELADAISDDDRAMLTADYRHRRTATDPVGVELGPRAGALVSPESESGIATLLDSATHVQAAADYLADLYPAGQPRRFYSIPVFLNTTATATLNPGDKITLTYDRFGCSAGRELRVIEPQGRAGDDLMILRCWGSAID